MEIGCERVIVRNQWLPQIAVVYRFTSFPGQESRIKPMGINFDLLLGNARSNWRHRVSIGCLRAK
jgi:hypothetical protein